MEDEKEEPQSKGIMEEIEDMLGKEAADRVKAMQHGDSVFSGGKSQYESVMKILAKAAQDPDKDYRQALLLSTFLNRDDATNVVAALDERKRYGVDITPVVDLVTAWAAVEGARGGRAGLLIEGQTSQKITTNMPSALKRSIFNRRKKEEPLS